MAGSDDENGEDEATESDRPVDDVALAPTEAADPQDVVDRKVPGDIRSKYEVVSYRNAAVILAETRQTEFAEILNALRAFTITTRMIRVAGGNESEMPKVFSQTL